MVQPPKRCVALAAAIILSGCGLNEKPRPRPEPPIGASAGDLEIAPCVHVANDVEYAAECGTLIVPENRQDENSRLISLPIKRIRASGGAAAEPIFYLTGGPGMSNLDYSRVEWFHENHDRIYRMNRLYNSNDINEDAATVSFPFGPALAADYPDMIKSMVRFFDFQVSEMLFEYEKDSVNVLKFNEEWFYLADSNVFQMFTFPLLEGDPNTVLDRPNCNSAVARFFDHAIAFAKTILRADATTDFGERIGRL